MILPQIGSGHADTVIPEDKDIVGKPIPFFIMPLPLKKEAVDLNNRGMLSLEAFISISHISFFKG